MMLYITLYIYALNNSECYSRLPIFKFSKENNSVKNVGTVIDIVLCLLSDEALYLYKVS